MRIPVASLGGRVVVNAVLCFVSILPWTVRGAEEILELPARRRVAIATNAEQYRLVETVLRWKPSQTAAIVCDMWDRHWCRGATARVGEMAPRMNALLRALRDRGVLIIHCPSETLKSYEDTPQRALAMNAPKVEPKVPLRGWCGRDPQREPPLPIDDSDGGCDDVPPCPQGQPWRRQIATLEILPGDAISDSGEVVNLMEQRGVENVLVMGVHLNMCVLGRPFGIRQLIGQGKHVVLVRDLTDTMYNSRQSPRVAHFGGTDLMVQHVESHWCPTVTSADVLDGEPFRFPGDRRPRVVVLIGEDEYATWDTLPAFTSDELQRRNLAATVLHELETDRGRFPGLERELASADVLLVSLRRRALPVEQLQAIRRHLEAGRGLVAIRTSSHGFAPRDRELARDQAAWPEFDAEVLGGNYQGHHGDGPLTTVTPAPSAGDSPLLAGVDLSALQGQGSLYRTSPLKPGTTPLLWGTIPGRPAEPLAWTRLHGSHSARVFYTSLGHVKDFSQPAFRRLLGNAVAWAAEPQLPAR